MPDTDWPTFLRAFNSELLSDDDICDFLTPDVVESGWLGFPGATAEEVVELQTRLDVALPPSYLGFLATSNGWLTTGWNSIRLWSVTEVGWLRDMDPGLIQLWTSIEHPDVPDEVYFLYGDGQRTTDIRADYLHDMLAISSRDWANQDQLWLNPRVRTADGEWEAWHFSTEFPGASRYRSFRDLMEGELRSARLMRDA